MGFGNGWVVVVVVGGVMGLMGGVMGFGGFGGWVVLRGGIGIGKEKGGE